MYKTFNIFTIGCQMNQADSERLKAYLKACGLLFENSYNQADLVILVTCGVRQMAEDRIYGLVKNLQQHNPKADIILTGCLSLRSDVRARLKDKIKLFFEISELPSLATKLKLPEPEKTSGSLQYLDIKPEYQSRFQAFVPIGNGCNNFCSYCVVPYARGREVYRNYQEIIDEVKNLVKAGFKEITLIAQNVNSYYSQEGENTVFFPQLLKVCDAIEGDWILRFATSHPKDMSEELIKAVATGVHTSQYFHLALQSGDDEILEKMNRKYTAEKFLNLIKLIRYYSPDAYISTDIIVGYPTEADEQFEHTAQLMTTVKFDMAYLAQYSPRPGTASAKLDDNVPVAVKAERELKLDNILRAGAMENAQRYLHKNYKILVEEVRQRQGQQVLMGKTKDYKTVMVPSDEKNLIGQFVEVEIVGIKGFGLLGKIK